MTNHAEIGLVDLRLPGFDGLELARRVRQMRPMGTLRLIALTGYDSARNRQAALTAGFDAFTVKPFSIERFEATIAADRIGMRLDTTFRVSGFILFMREPFGLSLSLYRHVSCGSLAMQNFHCQSCGQIAFFENVQCVRCGSLLGLLPHLLELAAFSTDGISWLPVGANQPRYRQCFNYASMGICNGMVMQDDPSPLCRSCRFTTLGPPLDNPVNHTYWYRLELAKRRLLHSLIRLGLPVVPRSDDPAYGLAFCFAHNTIRNGLENPQAIITGHDDGVISVNLTEADDVERERRRSELGEPYRTLLGHMRHESGHYYWMRLIEHSTLSEPFCVLFGSPKMPYAQALQTYYEHGAPSNWPDQYVSAYCAAHPWEDWAETWAHYLHIEDAIDTAQTCGLALIAQAPGDPHLDVAAAGQRPNGFDELLDRWFPITYALNSLNRSLGLPDAYPFTLSQRVRNKLSFVHQVIDSTRHVSA